MVATNQYNYPIGPDTWEDVFEARREFEAEAHMMGFSDPDDPKFLEALADLERFMDEEERIIDIEEQTGARQCPECGNFSCEQRLVEEHRDPTVIYICHDPYCGKVTI